MLAELTVYPTLAALGTWHYIAFLAVVLLLFGGKRIPELARGLARGLRIFRDEMHGVQRDIEESADTKPTDADTRPTQTQEKQK